MSTERTNDLIFIISGVILGILFAYLIGEIILQFIKYYTNGSQLFGFAQNYNRPSPPTPPPRHGVANSIEIGIDIFSPRFLESARASQTDLVRTFVEELRVEREKEGLRKLDLLPIKEFNSEENLSCFCNDCAICLDDFQEGDSCRLLVNCSHMFHSHCVDNWLTNNQRCPICRSDI